MASQYPGGSKSREAEHHSLTPQLFGQMTPLRDMAVNCLNKCKVQTTAKNLPHLPKKLQNTFFFLKNKSMQLTCEKRDKMPGASEQGRWGKTLVLAQTRLL